MIGLTETQQRLLDFLKDYAAQTGGASPTFEKMRQALGLASKSGVSRLLKALEDRGAIRRLRGAWCAIEVVPEGEATSLSVRNVATDILVSELARRGWFAAELRG